jgi:glycosyltransferase involved in cell wall biosynthesis
MVASPVPKLSVIVPVFNEAPNLRDVVERALRAPCPIEREWILVDDGSWDGSRQVVDELAAEHALRVIHKEEREGKGAAVVAGIRAATGDFIMVQDADFEYDPQDVPKLLQPLLDDEADVVYGSRFRRESPQVHRTMHLLINRALTTLSNLLSGIYLSDMETCYKVFRADLLKAMRLRARGFGFEVEATAYLAKVQARVFELPISYYPRTRTMGKKITWRDGAAALAHLLRFNLLTPRSRAFDQLPERYLRVSSARPS